MVGLIFFARQKAPQRMTPEHTNRLADESSPYLLQHALGFKEFVLEVFER